MTPAEAFAAAVLAKAKERVAEGSMGEGEEEIMALAERHGYGNVRKVIYDPAQHGFVAEVEAGDAIWFWGHLTSVEAWAADAGNWVCTGCGAVCVPDSALWRWNGQQWEHHHGYPIGHVRGERRRAVA